MMKVTSDSNLFSKMSILTFLTRAGFVESPARNSLENEVSGTEVSTASEYDYFFGSIIGYVSGCASSSWTRVSASGYTSSASG
jgi:hypothetical protein